MTTTLAESMPEREVPTEESPEVEAYCPTPAGTVIEQVSWGGAPSDEPYVQAIRVVDEDGATKISQREGATVRITNEYNNMINAYTSDGEPNRETPDWYEY